MAGETFRIRDIFSEAWKFTKANLGFLVGYVVIILGVSLLFSTVADMLKDRGHDFWSFLMHLVGTLVGFFIHMGFYNSALMITSGRKPGFEQLYANESRFVPWLLGNLLFVVMISLGFLFFIIPGFYLLARCGLFNFFILDKNMGAVESIKAAATASEGKVWPLFLLFMSVALVDFLGALFFGIGLLISIPLTVLALAVAYRKLTSNDVIVIDTPEP